ncbi:MAG: hypothetical protein ACTH31_01030, partial [Pseudoclavibacter sp.]
MQDSQQNHIRNPHTVVRSPVSRPEASTPATAPAATSAEGGPDSSAARPAATPDPAPIDAPVVDVDPAELNRDPYPTYERLRAAGPVVHAPAIGRYLATTHAAVIEAEQDQ